MEKKIVLLFLIFSLVLTFLYIRERSNSFVQVLNSPKPKYLCDHKVADCVSSLKRNIPKGVCAPGIACS